ncbi:MAG: hypothetical protein ACRDL5_07830, partial [Solirubrobacteraceae bacterium]
REAELEQRIAAIERELAATREAARRAAPTAGSPPAKPSREELGYYDSDERFSSILDDAGEDLLRRLRGFTQR